MSGGIIDKSTILQASDLTMRFTVGKEEVVPIKSVSVSIRANSFNIIFGPSGSGKTTLLNILGGLQKPTEGKVVIQDTNIYELNPDELAHFRANRVGYVHQTNHWIKSLSVLDNLALPLYAQGFDKPKAIKIAKGSLERVGMGSFAGKNPVVLSGGEQQRLALARALANEPLFIIADELTGNLDTTAGDNVMKLLLNCQTEFRHTIILVTHNMEYIPFADHLLQITDGTVDDIKNADTTRVTNKLIQRTKQRISTLEKVKLDAFHEK